MNPLIRPIPKEVRQISADPKKNIELIGILGRGQGRITTPQGKTFVFAPSFATPKEN
jgi:hypothetical protein